MSNSYSILIDRLNKFTKTYYINILVRGLFSIVAILLLLFIIFCVIEYFSFLNSSFRKILFWTYISVASILAIKFIFFPFIQLLQLTKKRISHKEAAKIIGLHFPEIEDKLINILELKNLKEDFGEDLIAASIEKKYKKIELLKFKSAVDWKTTFKYLKFSLVPFIILFIIFFTGHADIISNGTSRIIQYNNDFEPPAPFNFIITSDLQTLEKKDFVLQIKTTGNELPENVFIQYNKEVHKAQKITKNSFQYIFKSPRQDIDFEIFSEETWSDLMTLKILPAPMIKNMEVIISPPAYTGLEITKINDLGFIQVPEGSLVSWLFNSKNTNQIAFSINDNDSVLTIQNNEAHIEKTIYQKSEYSISTANDFEVFGDSIKYFIDVIKDAFPTISAEEIIDSTNLSTRFIKGIISDDYGFHSLVLSINTKDTTINKQLNIDFNSPSQVFFQTINVAELGLENETEISFLFTVYDNDLINGYKQSKTKSFKIIQPTKEELIRQYEEEQNLVEDGIADQLASLKELEEELERLEKNLIENEDIDWQDKLAIEETLKKYNQLNTEIEELKNKLINNRENRDKTQKLSESVLKKQQEIEKLFEEIVPEEIKELLEEIEKSLEELDKSNLQESLKKLQLSNEDIEKELDRNLKLLKELELEQKLESVIDQLDELAKKEKELSKKSLDKNQNKEDLLKDQAENLEKFENLKNELKELNNLDLELGGDGQLNTEKEQQEIEEAIENSLNQLEKNNKKRASKSQELSSERIKKLSNDLKSKQKEKSTEKQKENIETLRQILENLVYFSKEEESLMLEFATLYSDDPKYIELMHKQGDLRNDAKIIEDSLFALSTRVPQISATINREINEIQEKTESAINYFRERETSKGTSKQQYVMTSANNLAVLLSNILEQMQKELASDLPSSQECEKPGNGQPKPGDLKQMQKDLKEHLENLEKECKNNNGNGGFSKELAEMLAKQEQIRMALEEIQQNLENPEDQLKLKEAIEKMKANEEDIANKNISQETILRQEEIETRLLELEDALREQDESKERDSKEGVNYEKIKNDVSLKHEIEKQKQIELLKTTPPSLTNYYKKKVSNYFNLLLNNTDL